MTTAHNFPCRRRLAEFKPFHLLAFCLIAAFIAVSAPTFAQQTDRTYELREWKSKQGSSVQARLQGFRDKSRSLILPTSSVQSILNRWR
jgi:hypothetical protein